MKKMSAAALLLGLPGAYARGGPRGFDGTGDAHDLTGLIGREPSWSASAFGPYGIQVWDAIQTCGPFNMLPQGISWSDAQLRQMRVVSGVETPLSLGPIDHPQAACVIQTARDTEKRIREVEAADKADAAARENKAALIFMGSFFGGVPALLGLAYSVKATIRRCAGKAPTPDLEMQPLSGHALPSLPTAPLFPNLTEASNASTLAESDLDDDDATDLGRQTQLGKRTNDSKGHYTAAQSLDSDGQSNGDDSEAPLLSR